ncbi:MULTISPECIES: NUDIX domain-containing protein [unclassified Paenibacillus]|uniref:NUDIX domain-containing protein n=1 Tax=unclassified Paenibacillus TaxID=185978 RepID=UPI002784BD08|nr:MULTISPECIES: NUDIX domain-containing protein [unclassified Paenibacillus]MDQ0899156.1 8-oxo-dGTP pyrophosphatase MutT (NUDIX family) [Paenibacillus sp. V4I7]MDQ0914860.1 8-oxo-dGTP pyrophosphatase MutT (NUDIX family) [Paenibacillus sp. V4I5]
MNGGWHDSYLGKLRKVIGTQKIIVNSVRAILFDDEGRALFIKRRGDKKWGIPAGAMELDESVFDAMKREVKEETGLDVLKATLTAIYSTPTTQTFIDRWGNEHHIIEYLFQVDEWTGTLDKVTDESVDAKFYPLDNLPEASSELFANHHERVFKDYKKFDGKLILE